MFNLLLYQLLRCALHSYALCSIRRTLHLFTIIFIHAKANPSDILLFHKRRQAESAKGSKTGGGSKKKRNNGRRKRNLGKNDNSYDVWV